MLAAAATAPEHVKRHWVAVVGDRHPLAPQQGRRGPRPRLGLPRLDLSDVPVALPPAHLWLPIAAHVEAIERSVGDDEHTAGLIDGEGVADRLAHRDRMHGAARRFDEADDPLLAGEPDA